MRIVNKVIQVVRFMAECIDTIIGNIAVGSVNCLGNCVIVLDIVGIRLGCTIMLKRLVLVITSAISLCRHTVCHKDDKCLIAISPLNLAVCLIHRSLPVGIHSVIVVIPRIPGRMFCPVSAIIGQQICDIRRSACPVHLGSGTACECDQRHLDICRIVRILMRKKSFRKLTKRIFRLRPLSCRSVCISHTVGRIINNQYVNTSSNGCFRRSITCNTQFQLICAVTVVTD